MPFDFDGRIERSDFTGLFGLPSGAGRDAARAGVQAAGASLLGLDEPRFRDTNPDRPAAGGGDGPSGAAVAAFVALGLGLAIALRGR